MIYFECGCTGYTNGWALTLYIYIYIYISRYDIHLPPLGSVHSKADILIYIFYTATLKIKTKDIFTFL